MVFFEVPSPGQLAVELFVHSSVPVPSAFSVIVYGPSPESVHSLAVYDPSICPPVALLGVKPCVQLYPDASTFMSNGLSGLQIVPEKYAPLFAPAKV